MEVSYQKKWMGLVVPTICFIFGAFCSCTNSDEPIMQTGKTFSEESMSNAYSNYSMVLGNGRIVELEDTLIHELDFTGVDLSREVEFTATRSFNQVYGYDKIVPDGDGKWKKYLLRGMEEWGIQPNTIYIGRYEIVYKGIPTTPAYTVSPADYNQEGAPKNAIGWIQGSGSFGFWTSPTSDATIVNGMTKVFFVNCDISGRSLNYYAPNDPKYFVWAYDMIPKGGSWD